MMDRQKIQKALEFSSKACPVRNETGQNYRVLHKHLDFNYRGVFAVFFQDSRLDDIL